MGLQDITVEIRDANLTRVAAVPHELLVLTATRKRNNVGEWSLSLPAESPLAAHLAQPGAGIVISGLDDEAGFSGPMTAYSEEDSASDPTGTITFSGVTDDVILQDMRAWPTPSVADVNAQTAEFDQRTGAAETIMHAYVSANAGPSAVAERRHPLLDMGTNLGRGPVLTKAARFEKLGEILSDVANLADLNFAIVQRGDRLVFETEAVRDRTGEVRFSLWNNTIASHSSTVSAPVVTTVIVGGGGKGADRWFYAKDGDPAERARWGRRVEAFVDNSSSQDDTELEQSADEQLAQGGITAVDVQLVPMNDTSMVYGRDWRVGDRVTIELNGQEAVTTVSGWVLKADSGGTRFGALLGEVSDLTTSWATTTEQRVSAIERKLEIVTEFSAADITSGVLDLARIPAMDAGHIPNLDASKIAAGTLALARVPTMDAAHIPSLDASKIASGTLAAARLPVASTGAAGVVELATQAEVNTGTDAARAITPATLRSASHQPYAIAAGVVSRGPSAADSFTVAVTFPSGRFSAAPVVSGINLNSGSGATARWSARAINVTATGFTLFAFASVAGVTATFTADWHWTATQMTSTAGAG